MTVAGWVLGALAVLALGCLGYGVFIEQRCYQLRRVEVPILPPGHQPIKILHLSDLHLMPNQVKKQSWVRALARLQPDLIINTGDNLGSATALLALEFSFEPLLGTPGIFVLGSNDIYAPRPTNPLRYFSSRQGAQPVRYLPTQDLIAMMTTMGWANAEQQRLVFSLRDSQIEIRGCSDAHINAGDYATVMGESTSQVDILVAVTHAPYQSVMNLMVEDGVDLIFAGHTHGGQVCLPGGRALTTNCDLPTKQAKGLSQYSCQLGSAWLHVSAGLGTSPYAPYRFCCPPEASLLTLVERKSPSETRT